MSENTLQKEVKRVAGVGRRTVAKRRDITLFVARRHSRFLSSKSIRSGGIQRTYVAPLCTSHTNMAIDADRESGEWEQGRRCA